MEGVGVEDRAGGWTGSFFVGIGWPFPVGRHLHAGLQNGHTHTKIDQSNGTLQSMQTSRDSQKAGRGHGLVWWGGGGMAVHAHEGLGLNACVGGYARECEGGFSASPRPKKKGLKGREGPSRLLC